MTIDAPSTSTPATIHLAADSAEWRRASKSSRSHLRWLLDVVRVAAPELELDVRVINFIDAHCRASNYQFRGSSRAKLSPTGRRYAVLSVTTLGDGGADYELRICERGSDRTLAAAASHVVRAPTLDSWRAISRSIRWSSRTSVYVANPGVPLFMSDQELEQLRIELD